MYTFAIYDQRFARCGKPIVKVGINFDAKKGNIEDWTIVLIRLAIGQKCFVVVCHSKKICKFAIE